MGFLHKRTATCLIKTPRYKPSNESQKENYYHQILILFKTWRFEEELIGNFISYEVACKDFKKNTKRNKYLDDFKKRQTQTLKIQSDCEALHEKINKEIERDFEKQRSFRRKIKKFDVKQTS